MFSNFCCQGGHGVAQCPLNTYATGQGRLAMGGDGGKCLHFWAGGDFFRLGDVKISLRGGFFHDPGGDASMTQGGIDAPATGCLCIATQRDVSHRIAFA